MPKKRKKQTPGEVSKTQAVRVADVLVIGPLMGLGGMALRQTNKLAGNALILLGVGTTVYNARNFAKANEAMQKVTDED